MAKHSKWHNIKHKKAKTDAVKAKVYAKVAKVITVAARGWKDPSMNPNLAAALEKARYNSLPKHVVDKAILKGAWGGEWEALHEIFYEAYGPAWSALYIKCLTDNTNRSATNVRTIVNRMWGRIGEPNSVSRQFQEKGVIMIDGFEHKKIDKGRPISDVIPFDSNKLEALLLELPVEDIDYEDQVCIVTTTKDNFKDVVTKIQEASYHIDDADLQFLADNTVSLEEVDEEKFENLVEMLEDDEDVDSVYHNVE